MGGVVRGIGRAVSGVWRGVKSVGGGLLKGGKLLLQGKPLQALGAVGSGIWKGIGHTLKGGLGAVKEVLGDPLTMGVLGFMTPLGLGGALLAPMAGQALAPVFGMMENGVGNFFGINGQPAAEQMCYQQNYGDYGNYNGGASIMPGGCYPGSYYPQSYPSYGQYPPYGGSCGCGGFPNYPSFPSYPSYPSYGGCPSFNININIGGPRPYGCTPCCNSFY